MAYKCQTDLVFIVTVVVAALTDTISISSSTTMIPDRHKCSNRILRASPVGTSLTPQVTPISWVYVLITSTKSPVVATKSITLKVALLTHVYPKTLITAQSAKRATMISTKGVTALGLRTLGQQVCALLPMSWIKSTVRSPREYPIPRVQISDVTGCGMQLIMTEKIRLTDILKYRKRDRQLKVLKPRGSLHDFENRVNRSQIKPQGDIFTQCGQQQADLLRNPSFINTENHDITFCDQSKGLASRLPHNISEFYQSLNGQIKDNVTLMLRIYNKVKEGKCP